MLLCREIKNAILKPIIIQPKHSELALTLLIFKAPQRKNLALASAPRQNLVFVPFGPRHLNSSDNWLHIANHHIESLLYLELCGYNQYYEMKMRYGGSDVGSTRNKLARL